jgi:hypothetical protein
MRTCEKSASGVVEAHMRKGSEVRNPRVGIKKELRRVRNKHEKACA